MAYDVAEDQPLTGKEIIKAIWCEIRDDVMGWKFHWRPLTADEMECRESEVNAATSLSMLGRVDAPAIRAAQITRMFDFSRCTMSRA